MSILISQKNSVTYVEYCRIVSKDARVSYIKSKNGVSKSFSIPHLNLSLLLLGPGTSITSSAAKMLSSEGVNVGFTSGGGVPLFLASNSEYRPTEFLQNWIGWWHEPKERLKRGVLLQEYRIENVLNILPKIAKVDSAILQSLAEKYRSGLLRVVSVEELLGYEANFTKGLYKLLACSYSIEKFKRETRTGDDVNQLLDHGNYLAYGAASVALWGLGVPPSLAVIHGKTRRGALVFDIADVYKDAIILPSAFVSASEGDNDQTFRKDVINYFDKFGVLSKMFNVVKNISKVDCGSNDSK